MSRSSETAGRLYMVPVPLGDTPPEQVLPLPAIETVRSLRHFIVENAKTARRFLADFNMPVPVRELSIMELDKHRPDQDLTSWLEPARAGFNIGVMSEAGCPGVADPGSTIARIAHAEGIEVAPLVGPSSLLLALMASGLNGQSFAFNGYLPKDRNERIKRIRMLEDESRRLQRTQYFIETPYRNNALLSDLIQTCRADTLISIACGLTLPGQIIRTLSARDWPRQMPDLTDRPTVFLMLAQ